MGKNKVLEGAVWLSFIMVAWTVLEMYRVNRDLEAIQDDMGNCKVNDILPGTFARLVNELQYDQVFRDNLTSLVSEILSETLDNVSTPLIKQLYIGLGHTFLPQNFLQMMDILVTSNYTTSAGVLSEFFHDLSLASYQLASIRSACDCSHYHYCCSDCYWCCEYDDDDDCYSDLVTTGDVFEVVSQVTDIVSKVNYLGPNDIVSDGSTVGNILSQLQPQINATLADKRTQFLFSQNCLTLATRVSATNYDFCFINHRGNRECISATSGVRDVTGVISEWCQLLEYSTFY